MLRPFSLSLPGAQAFACDPSSSVAASVAAFARLAQATVVSRQKAFASLTCSAAPPLRVRPILRYLSRNGAFHGSLCVSIIGIGLIVFVVAMSGAFFGIYLQKIIPRHHRNPASKDAIKISTGLVATMAAVVLGFMVASAKDSFEQKRRQLEHVGAIAMHLDAILDLYGPEANGARAALRHVLERATKLLSGSDPSILPVMQPSPFMHQLDSAVAQLVPVNDTQREVKNAALQLCFELGMQRWVLVEQRTGFIELTYVWILTLWLLFIFVGFGLFAPANYTVMIAFFIAAFSVSCAIVLVIELDRPLTGFIRLPADPLEFTLQNMGQPMPPVSK